MRILFFAVLLSFLAANAFSQEDSLRRNDVEDKIKTGWTFGALPVVAYDSDLGLKYGGLVNFYNYGDGQTYPEYLHSIYLEVSRTTKGSGINQLFFDSEHLFAKPIRVTGDLSYLTEKALDFYGFNGYESAYNVAFEDDADSRYKSRMYYRHERSILRFTMDFQGKLFHENLRWLAGIAHFNYKIGSVDIEALNEGKDPEDLLPDTVSLYDEYAAWGIIPEAEADGGIVNYIKLGTVYDTRDNEALPMKGLWSEVLITTAPKFLGNHENAYTKLGAIHRQYFTLVPKKLSFAYRIGYQGTISGEAPFYMQPYLLSSYSPSVIAEGLGGAKSVRGILRNRIVGDAIAYGNFEFRWKFFKTIIKNQNLYLALSTFSDMGTVLTPIDLDRDALPTGLALEDYFDESEDELHISYGLGLHIALNENFIIAIDYGRPVDKRDGSSGLYIGMNFLF